MIELEKWNLKAIEAFKKILEDTQLPCIGFSLVFIDPIDETHHSWKWKTHLAFDPHDPPSEEERQQLEEAFGKVAAAMARILEGELEQPTH